MEGKLEPCVGGNGLRQNVRVMMSAGEIGGMRKLKDPEEKDRCGGVYGVHRALILPSVSQVEF